MKDFNAKTIPIMGSGWGWIVWNKNLNSLEHRTTPNQDTVSEIPGLIPLIGIDVWEHAYYLDYKNARPVYLDEVWKVIDWQAVEKRFNDATS